MTKEKKTIEDLIIYGYRERPKVGELVSLDELKQFLEEKLSELEKKSIVVPILNTRRIYEEDWQKFKKELTGEREGEK